MFGRICDHCSAHSTNQPHSPNAVLPLFAAGRFCCFFAAGRLRGGIPRASKYYLSYPLQIHKATGESAICNHLI